jgi:hypothetical protein
MKDMLTYTYRSPIQPRWTSSDISNEELFYDAVLAPRYRNSHIQKEGVINRYYRGIEKAQRYLNDQKIDTNRPIFEPDRQLPELSEDFASFFSVAQMHWSNLGKYKERHLKLLNLMSDPSTQTTKTFASLLMVGRAIEHIRLTGENIKILITTSGNKGIALRSAVERAITLGMVNKKQLSVVMLTTADSATKMRKSFLSENEGLWKLNPIILYTGKSSAHLKQFGRDFQEKYSDLLLAEHNTRLWYALDLNNYRVADSSRAFYEYENLLQDRSRTEFSVRLHVHAVSSGFGFIGYQLGRNVLVKEGILSWEDNPGYLLVQHLHTPDLVLQTYFNSFDRQNIPKYDYDESTGLYIQHQHAHFPEQTFDPSENLDPTFYTIAPPTAGEIANMIERFGGGGIVVSLYECLEKYSIVRSLLRGANIDMLPDPRKVAEWSTVMAITGAINAIDREIIPEQADLVIHATGYYAYGVDYAPICTDRLPKIDDDTSLDTLKSLLASGEV